MSQAEFDDIESRLEVALADLDTANQQVAGLEAELAAALVETAGTAEKLAAVETAAADATEQVAAVQAQLEEAEGRVLTLNSAVGEAGRRADEAEALVEELMLAFDDEIQALKAQVASEALTVACQLGSEAGSNQSDRPSIRAVLDNLGGSTAGFDAADLIEAEAVSTRLDECFDTAIEQARADEFEETLRAPKRDGFHTVGDEIAAGRWRSTGSGDECYWARLDSNQDVLDDHFGDAGGTVTIRSSDAEIEFDNCGIWEYLGP